ncbi:MAG TPA: hypothetical protein PLF08_00065 [Bacillota bacterium]|nr:hypothetical protein [Bacillota bacterium]HOQ02697.1 hypothetical protein [Bacillota bacterium]HPZ77905.1 hypothetical protein [Bacillota bacterium]HQD73573.1 hypothetical protein [Bacillota bacterium]
MLQTLILAAEAAPVEPKLGIFVNVDGAISGLIVSIFLTVLTYVMVNFARAGRPLPEIRKLPGLDSIEEAVGRATEMGRPVLLANRSDGVSSVHSFALWGYLAYVANLCAMYDTRLINIAGSYLSVAVNEEVIRQSYLEAGRPDAFNPEDIRYIPGDQWPWTAAVSGVLQREQPAACMWIGYWYAESMVLAEVAAQIGAIQIAATTNTVQIPFFIASCDYVLIGEEEYAASAYLSKEPVLTATIVAADIGKLVVIGIVLLGVIGQLINPEANFMDQLLRF